MFSKMIQAFTGRDDLERIALKGDFNALNAALNSHRIYFPLRPRRFLDASNFTQEELLALIQQETKDADTNSVDLWILDVDGKKRLPAFSSLKKEGRQGVSQ